MVRFCFDLRINLISLPAIKFSDTQYVQSFGLGGWISGPLNAFIAVFLIVGCRFGWSKPSVPKNKNETGRQNKRIRLSHNNKSRPKRDTRRQFIQHIHPSNTYTDHHPWRAKCRATIVNCGCCDRPVVGPWSDATRWRPLVPNWIGTRVAQRHCPGDCGCWYCCCCWTYAS